MEYINWLFTKRNEKAPDFVIVNLSIKTQDFIEWLKTNTNEKGYCNIDIKKSKKWDLYSTLNNFKPETKQTQKNEFWDDIIPF